MAVIRHGPAPEDHYSLIPNEMARNPNISLQAKGMYLYLRSHREGWAMSTERIGEALGVHRNSISKYVKELEDNGYLEKEQTKDQLGHFAGTDYVLMSTPLHKKATTDNPCTKTRRAVKTGSGEFVQHKKTNSYKKTKPTKEEQNLKPEFEAGFDAFWVKYPRKAGKDKAREKYAAALETSTVDELMKSVTVFAEECQHQQTEIRYIPYPGTWLNQKRYLDYLNAVPRKKSGKEKIDAALSWDVTKM